MYSTFWFKGCPTRLTFVKDLADTWIWDEDAPNSTAGVDSRLGKFGIIDCCKNNQLYKDLWAQYQVIDYTNDDILNLQKASCATTDDTPTLGGGQEETSNTELANTFKELGMDLSACAEVVYLFLFEKWSISSISSKIGITWSKIRYIIRTYKSQSRISKTLNRTESYKSRQKLSDDHIEWIRDLVRKNSGDIITSSIVRQKLLSTFPEVGSISNTTVRRYLKRKWNLTYK